MQRLPAAILAACALLSTAAPAADATSPVVTTTTRLGRSAITVFCPAFNTASCHYVFLNPLCQEKLEADGVKTRTCTYQHALPPFALRPGESRTIGPLPADFVHKMKVGSEPTAAEAVADPTPH